MPTPAAYASVDPGAPQAGAGTGLRPSPYQEEIWRHMAQDPAHLIVEAGPGSGKTYTLVQGLQYLTGRVVVTSFGADITKELKSRVSEHVRAQTLSGIGMSAILRYLKPTNRDPDRYKAERHAKRQLTAAGADLKQPDVLATFLLAVSWAKLSMTSDLVSATRVINKFSVAATGLTDTVLGQVLLATLQACAEDVSCFDYDDMPWLPLVRGLPLGQYDHVLVDELQDLSYGQLCIVRQLATGNGGTGRIIGVGDSWQSLYSWRGADSQGMLRVVAGLDAKTRPLPVSYRCAHAVIREAQRYVPTLEAAPGALEGLVLHLSYDGFLDAVRPGDGVAARTNAALASTALDLHEAGLEVTQLGAQMAKTYRRLLRRAQREGLTTVAGVCRWLAAHAETFDASDPDVAENIDACRALSASLVRFGTVEATVRHFEAICADEARASSVVLGTAHRWKGKEVTRIFVLIDTFRTANQEEKNCAYVAITRARTTLCYVSNPPKE